MVEGVELQLLIYLKK